MRRNATRTLSMFCSLFFISRSQSLSLCFSIEMGSKKKKGNKNIKIQNEEASKSRENGCCGTEKVLQKPVFLRALKLYVFCNKNIKKHEADRE